MTAADLLGVSNRMRNIGAGKLADLIAVAGNPPFDIRLLEDVRFVMKGGTAYKSVPAHTAAQAIK